MKVHPCLVSLRSAVVSLLIAGSVAVHAAGVRWTAFGPDGGDARAFASDPRDHNHVYLGTLTGWIYDSHDGGKTWTRLADIGKRDDMAIDNIVVDPSTPNRIIVGAWFLSKSGGGLYISDDGGHTWTENADLKGKSIRALVAAPSDPKMMVVGALDGIYRTADGGLTWSLISPSGSMELHEVESIAIDPKDPKKIFAGTWHLPWKTVDGGANWTSMKQGIIDDSDVFSIIVDQTTPSTMFASACSGIYKSINGGDSYTKVQGIPSTARRTRVLMQDSKNPQIVFAGTTEGLWRTNDGGTKWTRTSSPDVIVNDVLVDPSAPAHVLLATDRGGVLMSDDGGNSFSASNRGFSARQVEAFVADRSNPSKVYVGVINDKALGGVFASEDGGVSWVQKSQGLMGHDVLSLTQAADGTILAGTTHGLKKLSGDLWQPAGMIQEPAPPPAPDVVKKAAKGRKPIVIKGKRKPAPPPHQLDGVVYSMTVAGDKLYAVTSVGVLRSVDASATWQTVQGVSGNEWRLVAAEGDRVLLASRQMVAVSTDGGEKWGSVPAPSGMTHLSAAAIDETGTMWIGGREGVMLTSDGSQWNPAPFLPVVGVSGLYADRANHRVYVNADSAGSLVFVANVPDHKVHLMDAGWKLRFTRPAGDHLLGATYFDGMVVEQKGGAQGAVAGTQASTK